MKLLRDLVGNHGDSLRMRILVTFKLVYSLRKLYERIRRGFVD